MFNLLVLPEERVRLEMSHLFVLLLSLNDPNNDALFSYIQPRFGKVLLAAIFVYHIISFINVHLLYTLVLYFQTWSRLLVFYLWQIAMCSHSG